MISLNIGKIYHTLETQRTLNFIISNKYHDPTAEKTYIDGVKGCVEHVVVVQEVLQHAKENKNYDKITWFDLSDAFGSVPRVPNLYIMSHYFIPKQIITYITSLYSKLKGKVFTLHRKVMYSDFKVTLLVEEFFSQSLTQ